MLLNPLKQLLLNDLCPDVNVFMKRQYYEPVEVVYRSSV